MQTLYLSIDYGASATKVVLGLNRQDYQILVMPPEQIELDRALLPATTTDNNYVNRAWVGLGDKYYAVGHLAQTYSAISARKPLKSEFINQKTCAVVWVAAQILGLGHKFRLVMNFVLPPGELGDKTNRDLLVTNLQNALKSFDTPSGKVQVNLKGCVGYPEGLGLLLFHRKHFPEAQQRNIAIFMLGFRNSSVFYARQGVIGGYQSNDLGFSFCLKHLVTQCVGYNIDDLITPVCKYQETGNDRDLYPVLRTSGDRKVTELANLQQQIKISKVYYLTLLKTWIDESIDSAIDRVLVCGGTADYIRPELGQYLESKVLPIQPGKSECYFHSSIKFPDRVRAMNMGYRLADIFCLWGELDIEQSKK
jgi:hypothetical protein